MAEFLSVGVKKTTTQAPNRIFVISQEADKLATSSQRQVSHNFTRCILSLVLYMLVQNAGAARGKSCWATPWGDL